jgi:hypothetical protein
MANKGSEFVWAKATMTGKLVKLEFRAGTAELVRIYRYKPQTEAVWPELPLVTEVFQNRGLTELN